MRNRENPCHLLNQDVIMVSYFSSNRRASYFCFMQQTKVQARDILNDVDRALVFTFNWLISLCFRRPQLLTTTTH